MIHVLVGDLFESDAQTLVNTVNCVGVMGKGVALAFRERFPEMFEDYQARCRRGEVRLGQPYLYKRVVPPWILNFPTKDHWRSVSRIDDIIHGLEFLERNYRQWGIASLAVPPLGCGFGGLEWRVVGPTLYRHLSRIHIPVWLYAPPGTPEEQLSPTFLGQASPNGDGRVRSKQPQRINPAWVALVEILARVTREPYHWPIGRTAFQKMAYFATRLGLPTAFEFRRGSYGPFSSEVKPAITRLVNNGLVQEERLGNLLRVEPGITYADAAEAYRESLTRWESLIQQVADLFMRMDTSRAEIAATVDYVARELAARQQCRPTEFQVLEETMRWKQRRRPPLKEEHVAEEIRTLNLVGWIDLTPSLELPVATDMVLDV